MLEKPFSVFITNNDVITILQHLSTIENEFDSYYLELNGGKLNLVRNLFIMQARNNPEECQDCLLELKTN